MQTFANAAIKKKLVGTWKIYDDTMVMKSDGTSITSGFDSLGKRFSVRGTWEVRNGTLLVPINPNRTDHFTIKSITENKGVIQNQFQGRKIGIWTRIAADGR